MLQLRQLKTFLAAADTLNFTKAAHQVHLSQPSVTAQIQELEQSVGRALFTRKNNNLTLTPAGKALASRARELLAMADDALLAVREQLDERAATIRVAAPQTLCKCFLIPLLTDYLELHPGSRVTVLERNSSATAQAVVEGTADLGLVHGWPASDVDLQADLLARDRPLVIMPPEHPLSEATDVRPEALSALPLLVTTEGCRYREHIEALLQAASVRPHIRGIADSVPSLIQMVSTGLGVSILPALALDATATASVQSRPLSSAGEGLPICLLTTGREPARHVAAFIRMVRLAVAQLEQPMSAVHVKDGAGRVTVA